MFLTKQPKPGIENVGNPEFPTGIFIPFPLLDRDIGISGELCLNLCVLAQIMYCNTEQLIAETKNCH